MRSSQFLFDINPHSQAGGGCPVPSCALIVITQEMGYSCEKFIILERVFDMKQFLTISSALALLACAGASNSDRLPDMQYKEMTNYLTAKKISDGCGRYEATPDEESFKTKIDQELTAEGYTAQEAQDMIAAGVSDEDFNTYWVAFLDSLNVDPSKGMSYCTLGDRTRAARQDVGQYMTSVSSAQ